jgi:hypothetical protein
MVIGIVKLNKEVEILTWSPYKSSTDLLKVGQDFSHILKEIYKKE